MRKTLLEYLCEDKKLRDGLIELLAFPDGIPRLGAKVEISLRQIMAALLSRPDLLKILRDSQNEEDN